MQLEIGKKYITKDHAMCDYIEVIEYEDYLFSFPFRVRFYGGRYNKMVGWYESNGEYFSPKKRFDLVAEYQEEIEFDLEETQKQLERLEVL